MDSRYTTILGITFPIDYKDPNLAKDTTAGPDATASGDGLEIQGTHAAIKAGTRDPNGRITGKMGSIFLREGDTVEYNFYLKESDDGGNTGWNPVMTLGGKAGGAQTFTFGLTDDTIGANSAAHYGNVMSDAYVTAGAISVVGLPTTASTIIDIKFSSDWGATWHSIFPPGNDATGDVAYILNKIVFPVPANPLVFNPLRLNFSTFYNTIIPADSLLRVDTLQAGGATGININLVLGPKPHASVSGTGAGITSLGIVPVA